MVQVDHFHQFLGHGKQLLFCRSKGESVRLEPIIISMDPLYQFSGNILALKSREGVNKINSSKTAYDGFTENQKERLSQYGGLVTVNIPTIETIGGGSARCMMAEIFTPKK